MPMRVASLSRHMGSSSGNDIVCIHDNNMEESDDITKLNLASRNRNRKYL